MRPSCAALIISDPRGFRTWLGGGRSYLKGEFRGRKVVILLQDKRGKNDGYLVGSMETNAAATMDSHDFTNWPDRGAEVTLFALEVNHELRLTHRDGSLRRCGSRTGSSFRAPFEPPKWQSVLEAMHAVAGSLERRAA